MENVVTDGKWAQAHSVPIYRGGGTFVNLDSSILYIQQHHLLRQPSWIELLNIFGGLGVGCVIYIFNSFTYSFMMSTFKNQMISIGFEYVF